jgi:hypothetical protein
MAELRLLDAPFQSHPPPGLAEAPRQRRRAERRRVRVIAKVILPGDREECVLLSDISETGVRLRIPRDVALTVDEALDATLVLKVEARGKPAALRARISLVRVAEVTAKQVDLAFQFHGLTPEDVARMDHLRNLIFL